MLNENEPSPYVAIAAPTEGPAGSKKLGYLARRRARSIPEHGLKKAGICGEVLPPALIDR